MIPLRTLASLPPSERWLVLRMLPLVAAIRLALWVAPLRHVARLMRACERLPFSVPVDLPVPRLEWAVRAVSRRVPMASCLTQALALQFLLVRTGHSSEIHIGVRKEVEAGFQSHAWVECEGRMLLSTPSELIAYSRLLALGVRPDWVIAAIYLGTDPLYAPLIYAQLIYPPSKYSSTKRRSYPETSSFLPLTMGWFAAPWFHEK